MKSFEIVEKPVISEKSFAFAENGKYVFWVPLSANKIEIGKAIKERFKVDVVSINTVLVKGKVKSLKRIIGKRKDRKKAIVTLKKGQEIKEFTT